MLNLIIVTKFHTHSNYQRIQHKLIATFFRMLGTKMWWEIRSELVTHYKYSKAYSWNDDGTKRCALASQTLIEAHLFMCIRLPQLSHVFFRRMRALCLFVYLFVVQIVFFLRLTCVICLLLFFLRENKPCPRTCDENRLENNAQQAFGVFALRCVCVYLCGVCDRLQTKYNESFSVHRHRTHMQRRLFNRKDKTNQIAIIE